MGLNSVTFYTHQLNAATDIGLQFCFSARYSSDDGENTGQSMDARM
jgi:hypothetical protein